MSFMLLRQPGLQKACLALVVLVGVALFIPCHGVPIGRVCSVLLSGW